MTAQLETNGAEPLRLETMQGGHVVDYGLMGTDLIGQARTGTGKTLAFGIPVLQRSISRVLGWLPIESQL